MSANQQDNKTVAAKQPNIGYLNEKWETPRIGLLGKKPLCLHILRTLQTKLDYILSLYYFVWHDSL